MPLRINSSSGGYIELAAPVTASNYSLTLPTDSIQPALVKILDQSFTTAATVNVNNCFSSLYDNYKVILRTTASGNIGSVTARLRSSGTDASASNYQYNEVYADFGGAPANASSSSSTSFPITYHSSASISIKNIDFIAPFVVGQTVFSGTGMHTSSTVTSAVRHTLDASYDGFSILTGTGTISGVVRVYGYRN